MHSEQQNHDDFALSLLEESKRFLEKARTADAQGEIAFLHAALLLAFSSFEAHVSSLAEDFATEMVDELTVHEMGVLQEKEVRLEDGGFVLTNTLKMVRLEDRVRFLGKRFAKKKPLDFSSEWWVKFSEAIRLRNDLTHPKRHVPIKLAAVESAIEGIIGTLNALYRGIYAKAFPVATMQLDSTLSF